MITVNLKPCVIFALNLSSGDEERGVLDRLAIPFKLLVGVYRGKPERSYLVQLEDDLLELEEIIELCDEFKQESVLVLRSDRSAYRHYCALNNKVDAGTLKQVPRLQAIEGDYTHDPITNTYWVLIN